MKKISCDVIRDLLPLYKDNVCSDASKDMVEEHLTDCESCREYYEQMDASLPAVSQAKEETAQIKTDWAFFKKLSKKLTYRHILTAGGTAVALILVYTLYTPTSPYAAMVREKVLEIVPALDRRISTEDVAVQEVYRLEDGSTWCSFTVDSYISSFATDYKVTKSGEVSFSPFWAGDCNATSFARYWSDFHKAGGYTSSICYVVPEVLSGWTEDPATGRMKDVQVTSDGIYFIGKGGDILTLYEKGDPIPDAPADIQAEALEQAKNYCEETLEEWNGQIDHSFFYFASFNKKTEK